MYYLIGNVVIAIENLISLNREWTKFLYDGIEQSNVCIWGLKAREIYLIEAYSLKKNVNNIFQYKDDIMLTDYQWKNIQFCGKISINSIDVFTNQIFYTHAVQRRMIQIHSSMIDYQGKGLLFLGPSGIGKTTMAELWNKYRNALIINGDMNFVQETEECFLGWGTPWHGSSPYCENANVPVYALIVLKQAQENSIRRLEGFEKVQMVSNNIIYPTWLENGMELCLETLDQLLSSLPVYELSCRPDEDAVRLTEKTIFN